MAKANLAAFVLFILLLASLLAVPQETQAQATSPADDWPMFLHDTSHSGATTSAGPTQVGKLWSFAEGNFDGSDFGSSAAVVNGIVYVGSNFNPTNQPTNLTTTCMI